MMPGEAPWNHGMTVAKLAQAVEEGRHAWKALLSQVGESRMEEGGVEGEWSVKDIVAHITWHDREIVKTIQDREVDTGSELWALLTNERNAAIYRENAARPLRDVLDEADAVHGQLMAALQTLSSEDLDDSHRYAGLEDDWSPWKIIAENTYEHYEDHAQTLKAWLEKVTS